MGTRHLFRAEVWRLYFASHENDRETALVSLIHAHPIETRWLKMGAKSYTKTSRCWPGYEPVPGKSEHEEGSCRKKPASKNGGKEVSRETARKKQIALGGKRAEQAKA